MDVRMPYAHETCASLERAGLVPLVIHAVEDPDGIAVRVPDEAGSPPRL